MTHRKSAIRYESILYILVMRVISTTMNYLGVYKYPNFQAHLVL